MEKRPRVQGDQGKNFFRLCLNKIQERLFENGLRELMAKEYEFAGTIVALALSILQNGPVPWFIPEEILHETFLGDPQNPCIAELRKGLMTLGLYDSVIALPLFPHLQCPNEANQLSSRQLMLLLQPSFSEEGYNARTVSLAYTLTAQTNFMRSDAG